MSAPCAPLALALRRALITAICLGVTLGAHSLAEGGQRAGPAFMVVGGTITIAAMLIGPHRATFRPRSLRTSLALVLLVQALAHLAMSAAPWAFGLTVHHDVPLITPAALVLHLVAALLVALVIRHLERLVTAALAAVDAVRGLLRPARLGPPPRLPLRTLVEHAAAPVVFGSRAARAPPSLPA